MIHFVAKLLSYGQKQKDYYKNWFFVFCEVKSYERKNIILRFMYSLSLKELYIFQQEQMVATKMFI